MISSSLLQAILERRRFSWIVRGEERRKVTQLVQQYRRVANRRAKDRK